jgi:hypothetical protein
MATVNSEIERILRLKDQGILGGSEAIIRLLENLQSQVIDELGRAAIGSWDAYHLRQVANSIQWQINDFRHAADSQITSNINDAWKIGQVLVDAPLATQGIYVGFHISTSVLEALRDFAFHKIDGLSTAAWDKIRGELTIGILGQKTPQQVADAIGRNLTEPSIFKSIADRAEVITQTEMGRTFSTAAEIRMEEAGKYVDGLEKQWRHVGHPKVPRATHLAADGQIVPVDQPFNIGGVEMMYPRDPAAPLDEVINCG